MFNDADVMSSFSVDNLDAAKEFYSQKLGLKVEQNPMALVLMLNSGGKIFIYPKDDHLPATFTVLNFAVKNIDEAVKLLNANGITLKHYEDLTDSDGIMRGLSQNRGPDIAWFKDPAGNILSALQES